MVPPLVLGHGFSSFVRRKRSDRRSAVDQVFGWAKHSVLHFPGFSRDFDCFDSENQWDGIVVFVGF